ncbi:MAG: heparinase II/III-family protein, partial [Bacteroidota bacterium]
SSDASLGLPPSGARGLDQSSSDVSVKTGHDPASDTSDELSAGYTRRKYASDERPLSSGIIHKTFSLNPDRSFAAPASDTSDELSAGYARRKDASDERSPGSKLSLWIDAAQIGPSYIPGHAHADSLTFVLHHNGQPIIVDPSISTYEKNARRAWERSTAAHNTVVVGGANSSDVWGGFRVGKRATTYLLKHDEVAVVAEHDGYGAVRHRRSFRITEKELRVTDILSQKDVTASAFFHFAPGQEPEILGESLKVGPLRFTFTDNADLKLFTYQSATGFNTVVNASGLEVVFRDRLDCAIRERSK